MIRSTLVRFAAITALGFSGAAVADLKTVTLEVPGMNCSACPVTVKHALKNVKGVEKVSVTYEPKEAVVTFDDAKTSIGNLQDATRDAGYPSTPKIAAAEAKGR